MQAPSKTILCLLNTTELVAQCAEELKKGYGKS